MSGNRVDRRAFVVGAGAAAVSASAAEAQVSRVEVPFRLRENQPLTQLTIDGQGPYTFLIDTGASDFVVDDGLARELRLRPVGVGRAQGAVGRAQAFQIYQASEVFVAGGIRERNVFMGGLSAFRGDRFTGLFPMPRNVEEIGFDFERSRFIVDTRPPAEHPGFERMAILVETRSGVRSSRQGVDPSPRVRVAIDGRPATLVIDSGAQGAVFVKPDFVRANGLFDAASRHRDVVSMGMAGPFRTRLAPVGQLQFGAHRFDDVPVHFGHPDDSGRDGWGGYDGLLGVEVLRRLNFFIKPRRDELWLRPNRHFGDVFRVDRSGLSLQWVDGRVQVRGVAERSPAAASGLRVGDVVTASSAGDGSFDGLVWALSDAPGAVIQMAVARDGAAVGDLSVTLDDGYGR